MPEKTLNHENMEKYCEKDSCRHQQKKKHEQMFLGHFLDSLVYKKVPET